MQNFVENLISFFLFRKKCFFQTKYTQRGWQARVSEISKKLKIAQKPKQKT